MPLTRRTLLAGAAAMTIAPVATAAKKDTYLYELRVYHCHPGRTAALHTRFQKRTIGIFKRCGMEVMGFWDAIGAPNDVVYLVRHKNREAREKAWQAFGKDPEWPLAV
ncbi:MAG: NIPSNAP family protein, partial [Armatimonadaceae bacterium]